MNRIFNALISVYDKSGIENLASHLIQNGVRIISSGGTQHTLENAGIDSRPISELTSFPEILDGRVKTLHPLIFGGILATNDPKHLNELQQHKIESIDLIIVNLYPFEDTILKTDCTLEDAIEKIDIGGPSLIRAAAKNFNTKTVITNPEQYEELIEELKKNDGNTSLTFRHKCAARAFQHVARYNAIIADYLDENMNEKTSFQDELTIQGIKLQELRYGENPHQRAAFYGHSKNINPLNDFKKLHGKELSYNNIIDLDAALSVVQEFEEPATVIIKHTNPCGAAIDSSLLSAYKKALSTDSLSAFGGIVGLNKNVDMELAEEMSEHFFECILAPEFEENAIKILSKKKNLRLITYRTNKISYKGYQLKTVAGGFLIQTQDTINMDITDAKVVSARTPTKQEWESLKFAWKLVKHVHSNAIIFTDANRLIGVGAGQMSRVDSVELAITKAIKAGNSTQGTVVASDAFFPFKDGVEALAKAGATAVVQPGGSVRDEEVIQAANNFNIAMIFTGNRHFKH